MNVYPKMPANFINYSKSASHSHSFVSQSGCHFLEIFNEYFPLSGSKTYHAYQTSATKLIKYHS